MKAFLINSVDDFHARGVELEKHRGHGLYILQFGKLFANLDGHRRASKGEQERRGRWLQHDIRTDAFNSPRRFGQQAAGQPDDQHTHHGCLFSVASPTGTNSDSAGCSSLNRSAEISSFMMTLVTRKSSL